MIESVGTLMVEKVSSATWGGALIAFAGALSVNQWLAIGGFSLALGGFVVNLWHKRQVLKIEWAKVQLMKKDKEN